jgi:hypothetical protein
VSGVSREWSGVECRVSGVEWSVVSGVSREWSGVEWSGVEWSGVDWSGLEWIGVDWSGMEWVHLYLSIQLNLFQVSCRGVVIEAQRYPC